jgi:hypothetical protein
VQAQRTTPPYSTLDPRLPDEGPSRSEVELLPVVDSGVFPDFRVCLEDLGALDDLGMGDSSTFGA